MHSCGLPDGKLGTPSWVEAAEGDIDPVVLIAI